MTHAEHCPHGIALHTLLGLLVAPGVREWDNHLVSGISVGFIMVHNDAPMLNRTDC